MLFRFVEYPLLSNRWNICPAALQSASQIHLEWPKIVFPIIISQRKRKVKNLRQYRKWKDLRGGTSGRKGGVEAKKRGDPPSRSPKKKTDYSKNDPAGKAPLGSDRPSARFPPNPRF